MTTVQVGDRYSASRSNCHKFPLPVKVIALNPVRPEVVVENVLGNRTTMRLSAMQSCIVHNCISLIYRHGTSFANALGSASNNIGTCNAVGPVVSCSYGGWQTSQRQTATNGHQEITKMADETTQTPGSVQTIPFVKMQNASGRYAIFQVPGHRGRIYVDTKLFPNVVTPPQIQISGLLEASAEAVTEDTSKAAAKAAKAQAKAEAMQAKAQARLAKANEAIAKAKAQAEAALARATKLAAAVSAPASSAPESANVSQPEF